MRTAVPSRTGLALCVGDKPQTDQQDEDDELQPLGAAEKVQLYLKDPLFLLGIGLSG